MDASDVGADLKEVLIPADRVQRRVAELAAQIDADYAGRELLLVGVLKGAVMVMADLARAMREIMALQRNQAAHEVSAQPRAAKRVIARPAALPPSRGTGNLVLVQDVMISGQERVITTLPSSQEDFAVFQAQRRGLQGARGATGASPAASISEKIVGISARSERSTVSPPLTAVQAVAGAMSEAPAPVAWATQASGTTRPMTRSPSSL